MTEPISSRQTLPHKAQNRPGTGSVDRFPCVYCTKRHTSGDSLWDHVKRDHTSKIQRHGAPGELESLKREVISASVGKERRLQQKSKGPVVRTGSRISTETAPSSIDITKLTLDTSPRPPIRGRRYQMVRGNSGAAPINPRRAADRRGTSKKQYKRQDTLDAPALSDNAPGTPDVLSEGQTSDSPPSPTDSSTSELLLQPQSKEISEEQLSQEVKSIYAGLTMVESKCIHVCDPQSTILQKPEAGPANTPTHWQALITLHRTLLHEHHDFFLASQHPSAGPALKRLALKYSMPARMWKHGIFSFLELLRHRLPETLEYLLSFLILAYQMIALLYETVPAFEDTWIECLGDLARYRMAIDDTRDRDTWQGVARHWYTKAASRNPSIGRLFHHLAILARPKLVEQLYFYCRSLTCVQSFLSSRESIKSLFDPSYTSQPHLTSCDTALVKAHCLLFERSSVAEFESVVDSFLQLLDNQIGRITIKWKEQGAFIAIVNITAVLDYGSRSSFVWTVFRTSGSAEEDAAPGSKISNPPAQDDEAAVIQACRLLFSTFGLVLQRIGDQNVLPHINLVMEFLYCCILCNPSGTDIILRRAPWPDIANFLNILTHTEKINPRVEQEAFPEATQPDKRPLPEDFLAQGQIWCARHLFPDGWFNDFSHLDEEERSIEHASMTNIRQNRIAWLGIRLATRSRWIQYDQSSKTWSATSPLAGTQVHFGTDPLETPGGSDVLMIDAPTETIASGAQGMDYPAEVDHPQRAQFDTNKTPAASQTYMANTQTLLTQFQEFRAAVQSGNYHIIVPEHVIMELRAAAFQDPHYRDAAGKILAFMNESIPSAGKRLQAVTEKGQIMPLERILQIGERKNTDIAGGAIYRSRARPTPFPRSPSRFSKNLLPSKSTPPSKSRSPPPVEIASSPIDWADDVG